MKTFVKNILAVCAIIFASAVPASAYDFEVDGMYFNLLTSSNLACEIVSGEIPYSGDFIIPETITYRNRDLKVTKIGEEAFSLCHITGISIPNSVTEIGKSAFSTCSFLTNISLPNSVIKIGDGTFSACTKLKTVKLSENLLEIGGGVFSGCYNLEEITVPNSVIKVGIGTFSACTKLKTVKLSQKLEAIKEYTFSGCENLREISIPPSVEEIGYGAFLGCDSIETLTFEKGKSIKLYNNNQNSLCIFKNVKNLTVIYRGVEYRVYKIGGQQYTTMYDYGDFIDLESVEKLVINSNGFDEADDCHNAKIIVLEVNYEYGSPGRLDHCDSLKKLILKNEHPIACPYFTTKQYLNVTLYVPKGSLSAYQNADGWINFWDIREGDGSEESGIEEDRISSERQEIGRYDIQGRKVSEDYKGFVIIRYSDGSVRKILNK